MNTQQIIQDHLTQQGHQIHNPRHQPTLPYDSWWLTTDKNHIFYGNDNTTIYAHINGKTTKIDLAHPNSLDQIHQLAQTTPYPTTDIETCHHQ